MYTLILLIDFKQLAFIRSIFKKPNYCLKQRTRNSITIGSAEKMAVKKKLCFKFELQLYIQRRLCRMASRVATEIYLDAYINKDSSN